MVFDTKHGAQHAARGSHASRASGVNWWGHVRWDSSTVGRPIQPIAEFAGPSDFMKL